MKSINPYNQQLIKEYSEDDPSAIEAKIATAENCFQSYRQTTLQQRIKWFEALAADLKGNAWRYAETLTLEMGKPIKEAVAEVEKCAWVCEYYASEAPDFLAEEKINTDADRSWVRIDPLGVILGVMPWNFPFWQVFRFAVPTMMAGNTVLLKHASNVQGSAFLIQRIFEKAGFPTGAFQNLCISSDKVERVLRDKRVKGASVTGSEKAGAAVAAICGEEIKPSLLELGGSNAFIVLEDADLDKAAALAVKARMVNNAQSCIAAKRFIVVEAVYDRFVEVFIEKIKALKEGDPIKKDTEVGPMARVDLAEELEEQLQKSLKQGAILLQGGKRDKAHFQPTVIGNVQKGMPAYEEELFGPVAPLIKVKDREEAIAVSNDSRFGLGLTIVSRDVDKLQKSLSEFEDGAVFINELVKSDPRLPFGGTKKSGYGRELSQRGIYAFVNFKTVYLNWEIS